MVFRARVWRIMAVACILQAAGWAAADCPVNSSTASWHLSPYTDPDPAIGGPVRPEHLTCISWLNGWRAFTFEFWTPELLGSSLHLSGKNLPPNTVFALATAADAAGNPLPSAGTDWVSCGYWSDLGTASSYPPLFENVTGIQLPTQAWRTCGSIATANADALPPAGAAIGSAVLVNSAAECCRLCTNTVACRQWGFASSNGSEAGVACTLFSTYSASTTSSPAVIVGPSAGWGVGFVKCTGPGTSQVAAAVLSVSGAINYTCFRNDAYQWGTLTGFRFPTASARITVPAPPGPPVPAGCSGVPPTASSAEPFDAVACNGLASGQACTAPCVTGYEGAARATCTQGVISVTSTCAQKPCMGVPPQTIPNAADWPQQCSPTASGSSCAGSCVDATYKGAPVLVCSLGVFTASGSCTRSQPGPCRASPDSSSITNASPFGSDCDNTPNQGVCTTGCHNGFFGRLRSRCIGLGVWGPVSGQCTRAPETPCKSLPAETIPNQQPWPESCADPGTASGEACDASCLDFYQGGGAKAQCFDGKWLHAGGSCVPKPAGGNNPAGNDTGSTSQEEATGGYLINASDTADISELLDNLPNQLYIQLSMQPPDTPANVQVDVEVVSGRRRLQQANAVVLKVRVAVVGAKSVDADVLTRRLSSQATTDAVAKGLAVALAAAGRDVTDGSVLGTITAIDSAGAIVGPPLLIKVDCSSSSLKPLSGRDVFVESEPTEVQAGFRMVLPFVAGAITLNPSLDGRAAGCSVQPSDLDGRQDSTDVLVTCSGSIWSGPHTIALQVVYACATHGCRGATLTELTKVLVQPVKPAPAASLSVAAAPQPPACKAASHTADWVYVVGRFDYKLLPDAGVSAPMTITELKATASSPAATCSAQQQGPSLLHSGTVQVTCVVQGVIPPSLDRVGLSLSLTASQQGATVTATANTTVDLVCCTPPSTIAHAVATARPAPHLCCGSGAAAAVYHNVGASGVLQGTMATDVSPACSTSAGSQTFGSVTVSCDAARRLLEFNVSNPLGTTAAIEFLVSCSKPAARPKTASNACAAGTDWKRVLLGSKATALGARLELAGTTATVSWVYKMTENSRSCSCSSAYVAVRQVGRFAACSSQELKALHD